MLQQSIRNTQVAFCIFKIYRVYFMRHGTAANFAFFSLLLKIIHADVGPHIPAKIYDDGIDAFDGVKMCSERIKMFYLSCVLLALQAKFMLCKIVGKLYPVVFWKRNMMCVKIT